MYLSELLLAKGYQVYGLVRGQNNPKAAILADEIPEVIQLPGDLSDLASLQRALAVAQPDEIYNLGAISYVAYSWQNAHLTADVTGKGVLNMLDATLCRTGDPILPGCASTRRRARRCSGRSARRPSGRPRRSIPGRHTG